MDLYRYFHPHHNPRLRRVPIRLQELAELEQAAEELKRALARAKVRVSASPVSPIEGEHFRDILTAMNFVVDSLHTLHEAHPGDDREAMAQLLEERKTTPGWENWSRLLLERLHQIINEPADGYPALFAKNIEEAETTVEAREGPETFGAVPLCDSKRGNKVIQERPAPAQIVEFDIPLSVSNLHSK